MSTKPVGTFMGIQAAVDPTGARAAILGIPFDCGLHSVRLGARMGPSAIRAQSSLVRPYQPPLWDFNPLEVLGKVSRYYKDSPGSTSLPWISTR